MSHDQKISSFANQALFQDADLITFVRNGTNFNGLFSTLKLSLGVSGSLNPVGSSLGVPVLEQPAAGVNNFRSIESGNGIIASVSAENGVNISLNISQDSAGIPITSGLSSDTPVMSSFVAGTGISIIKTDDSIEIKNTIDPATGLSNRVVVTQASDLAGVLDSTKEYFIDGIIDMGSQSIDIPAGGLNLSGYNFDVSQIISSEASYVMFTSPIGGSGNLLGKDYGITTSGTGSQVYNLTSNTGFDAFELARINYNNCESLGSITNYRQGLETGTGRFGGKPQLELIGTWVGGYFIDTSIVRSLTDGAYSLFKAGAGFVMSSRFRSNQNIDLPASVSFLDFSAGNFINPSTLQLDGCLISREGVFDASDANILPNVLPSDLISSWKGNNGIQNTFVGGQLSVSSESNTTISSAGVYVDLAGTFLTSDLQHFDSPSNGQLRHLGTSPMEFRVSGQVVIDGGSGDTVAIKIVIFRDATTSFEDGKITSRVVNNIQGGGNVAYYGLVDNITLGKNDYVKLQVANTSDTSDVTAELDSFFIVEAR